MVVLIRVIPSVCSITFGALIGGCAGVDFYSDSTLKPGSETGIPIYASKPYLLVARTGAKDKPAEITVVHLSDPSKVIYAKPRSGFGSSNLTLALTNGQMTSFGQQVDTKIPELITSLAGMVTARAGATKTEAEAEKILASLGTQQAGERLAETGEKVVAIATEMAERLKGKSLLQLTDDERKTVSSVGQALRSAGNALKDAQNTPEVRKQSLETIAKQTEILSGLPSPTTSTRRDEALQFVQTWVVQLNKLINSAKPEVPTPPAPPTFELYEIVPDSKGGSTILKPVSVSDGAL